MMAGASLSFVHKSSSGASAESLFFFFKLHDDFKSIRLLIFKRYLTLLSIISATFPFVTN